MNKDDNHEIDRRLGLNKKQAEGYIYESYIKAENNLKFNDKDEHKRHPELTRKLIEKNSGDSGKNILVTGSKGKGSVAIILCNILKRFYKTGLMTSPHISDICERFRIDFKNIDDDSFVGYTENVRKDLIEINKRIECGGNKEYVSPMGIQSLIALKYFNDSNTDINIFECGKGVKYDDVNNIIRDYGIINTVFLEHTRELGDTLEDIAEDKACLIEKCKYVVIGKQKKEVVDIFKKRAEKSGTQLCIYGEDEDYYVENVKVDSEGTSFDIVINALENRKEKSLEDKSFENKSLEDKSFENKSFENKSFENESFKNKFFKNEEELKSIKVYKSIKDIRTSLYGVHQAINCAMAYMMALKIAGDRSGIEGIHNGEVFKNINAGDICENAKISGIFDNTKISDIFDNTKISDIFENSYVRKMFENISIPGRFEIIKDSPKVILDACINKESCEYICNILKQMEFKGIRAIIGIPDDKDYLGVVSCMSEISNEIILTKSTNPHYVFTNIQKKNMIAHNINVLESNDVVEAYKDALNGLKEGYGIVILGTTSLISDVYRCIKNEERVEL